MSTRSSRLRPKLLVVSNRWMGVKRQWYPWITIADAFTLKMKNWLMLAPVQWIETIDYQTNRAMSWKCQETMDRMLLWNKVGFRWLQQKICRVCLLQSQNRQKSRILFQETTPHISKRVKRTQIRGSASLIWRRSLQIIKTQANSWSIKTIEDKSLRFSKYQVSRNWIF